MYQRPSTSDLAVGFALDFRNFRGADFPLPAEQKRAVTSRLRSPTPLIQLVHTIDALGAVTIQQEHHGATQELTVGVHNIRILSVPR
jgi:hypothetical protein